VETDAPLNSFPGPNGRVELLTGATPHESEREAPASAWRGAPPQAACNSEMRGRGCRLPWHDRAGRIRRPLLQKKQNNPFARAPFASRDYRCESYECISTLTSNECGCRRLPAPFRCSASANSTVWPLASGTTARSNAIALTLMSMLHSFLNRSA